MENHSYTDDKSDGLETQQTSQDPGLVERPRVEKRQSIHSANTGLQKDNPTSHQKPKNLYPSLSELSSQFATGSSCMTPLPKQAVSSKNPNLQVGLYMKIAIIVVLVAVILGVSWRVMKPDKQRPKREEQTGEETPLERLRERFRYLRLLFSGQTGRLWTVSLAAIRPLLDRPRHPAVILLAGSKRVTTTTDCLALKMSEAVKDALEVSAPVVVFDCRRYRNWNPEVVKREMDKQLTEAFENGARVGVVLGVESLPGTSPMIFYRFCDTANAPFKNIVLILTLNMEQEAKSDRDSEAHEELSRLWNSVLDAEQVDPLFSRIGNSVAYVSEETDLSHCQKND